VPWAIAHALHVDGPQPYAGSFFPTHALPHTLSVAAQPASPVGGGVASSAGCGGRALSGVSAGPASGAKPRSGVEALLHAPMTKTTAPVTHVARSDRADRESMR
jgi:hypothetical protein